MVWFNNLNTPNTKKAQIWLMDFSVFYILKESASVWFFIDYSFSSQWRAEQKMEKDLTLKSDMFDLSNGSNSFECFHVFGNSLLFASFDWLVPGCVTTEIASFAVS